MSANICSSAQKMRIGLQPQFRIPNILLVFRFEQRHDCMMLQSTLECRLNTFICQHGEGDLGRSDEKPPPCMLLLAPEMRKATTSSWAAP